MITSTVRLISRNIVEKKRLKFCFKAPLNDSENKRLGRARQSFDRL